MVFGDPYRFAIWIENIPSWNTENSSFCNGLFHYIINGEIFPGVLRTSTLSVDVNELTNDSNALVSCPENNYLFSLSTEQAFEKLYQLNYPQSTVENEYPEQNFTYSASTENLTDDGVMVFAVTNHDNIRILAAKTKKLVENKKNENFYWEDEYNIKVNEIMISKTELKIILENVKSYYFSINNEFKFDN